MKKPSVVSKLHGSKMAGPTSPGQANAEMGRFKSIAGSAPHLAAMGKGELAKAGLPAAPKAPTMPTAAAPAAGAKNTIAAAAGAKPPSAKPAK